MRDPVYICPFLDENQLRATQAEDSPVDTYERGVWYYAGYPLTDHHDMAGLTNFWRDVQTLLGLEYRPTFWINIYNRLRNLDFSEEDDVIEPLPVSNELLVNSDVPKRIPSRRSMRSNKKSIDIVMMDAEEEDYEEDEPLAMLSELPGKGDLMFKQMLTGIKRQTSGLITRV